MQPWIRVRRGINLNRFMDQRMIFVVGSGLIIGAIFHNIIPTIKPIVPYLFAYMTFSIAVGSGHRDFINALRRPGIYGIILASLHLILPLFATILARTFLPEYPQIQAGIILGTAIPIGVASTIWVNISQGDTTVSLTSVILDTLLSPLVVTTIILLAMGTRVDFDVTQLMSGLLYMVVLPTIAGVIVHDLTKGKFKRKTSYISGPLSKLFLTIVIATNLATAWSSLHLMKSALTTVMLLCITISCSGYLLGYGLAKLLKLPPQLVNTFIFTIGMRNITAGLVMALNYFPEITAIPVVFAILCQQPLAALSHRFLVEKVTKN